VQYTISESALHHVETKLAALIARGKKLGSPVVVTITQTEDRVTKDGAVVRYLTLDVQGNAPKLGGWSLAAELENVEGKVLVRTVPGNEIPVRFQHVDPTLCEHCNQRRFRSHTYVLRHEDGRLAQVGSACIKDFLGHEDPQSLIAHAELELEIAKELADADEYDARGLGGSASRWTVSQILALTASAIREHGWVSKANATSFHTATAIRVADALTHNEEPKDELHLTDEDLALSTAALAWGRTYFEGKGVAALSDYENNLKVLVMVESAKVTHLGFLCSLIPWYQREQAKAQEAAKVAPKATSNHVGTIGKRQDFTLTVKLVLDRASDFGVTHIHKMVDEAGNEYTWFASSECLEQGQTYTLKATVKAHDEYKGTKQTIITRAKVAA
jgi:hypothetical protein